MIELVQRYYAEERQTGLEGFLIGLSLAVLAVILWRTSSSASLARGISYALVVAGLLQAAASGGYAIAVPARSARATAAYAGQPDASIQAAEVTRMRGVLASSFVGGLVTFTGVLLVGLALVFVSHHAPTRKGVGLALMMVGVLGHSVEAFSMQKNRTYLEGLTSQQP